MFLLLLSVFFSVCFLRGEYTLEPVQLSRLPRLSNFFFFFRAHGVALNTTPQDAALPIMHRVQGSTPFPFTWRNPETEALKLKTLRGRDKLRKEIVFNNLLLRELHSVSPLFFPVCLTALGFLAFGHDKGESGRSHSWEEPCVCMVNRESHGAKAVVRQSRGRGGGKGRERKRESEGRHCWTLLGLTCRTQHSHHWIDTAEWAGARGSFWIPHSPTTCRQRLFSRPGFPFFPAGVESSHVRTGRLVAALWTRFSRSQHAHQLHRGASGRCGGWQPQLGRSWEFQAEHLRPTFQGGTRRWQFTGSPHR